MSTNSNPHCHEAIQAAVSLWDSRDEDGRLRDLEPHEEAFLSAVHDARNRLDDESCEAALNAALEAYRAFDPDADDEVEIGRAA